MQSLKDGSHMGYVIYDCLRSNPEAICQIDAASGEEETNASVLSRSIRLARSLRKFGLHPGDVLAFSDNNHIDLHIPYYAALLNGLPIVGADPGYKYDEIRSLLKITRPSIAFCSEQLRNDYEKAASELDLKLKIVCYGNCEDSMDEFVKKYDTDEPESDFKIADFDVEEVYIYLVSTSGTSGFPKVAAFKHRVIINKFISFISVIKDGQPARTIGLNLSPAQWISGIFNAVSMPIMNQVKLQTSKPDDMDHYIDIINKYKPNTVLLSPTMLTVLLQRKEEVNLSCFKSIIVTGAKTNPETMEEIRDYLREITVVMEAYGSTETIGPVLLPNTSNNGSCGKASVHYEIKLVDPETEMEIKEPFVTGEMWVRGLCFTGYLHCPEDTKESFTDDGFYKTGDLLYRDENQNFYFVERIKMLIKYRNSQIVPTELEEVILHHPGVEQVCVTAIPHPEDGQHPVAWVVRKPGSTVTAQEIKELVSNKLSKNKALRGGVVFLDSLPMTSTGKVARGIIKELAENADRE